MTARSGLLMLHDQQMASPSRSPGDRDDLLRAPALTGQRSRSFDGLSLVSVSLPAQSRFERCSFVGSDLRQASLDGAFFKMCDFSGADLRGASLRGTRFAACDLREVDLRGADLRGASFGSVNTGDDRGCTVLTAARIDSAQLARTEVEAGTRLPDGTVA